MLGFLGVGSRRQSTIPSPAQSAALLPSAPVIMPVLAGDDPRMIAREGWMTKEGEVFKTWKKRYFRLEGLTIAYYTENETIKGLISLQCAILRTSNGAPGSSATTSSSHAGTGSMDEYGFEIVCSPSIASCTGQDVLSENARDAMSASALSSSSSSSSSSSKPAHPVQVERVYSLNCLDASLGNAASAASRRSWIAAISNNINYARNERLFKVEREETSRAAIQAIRNEMEGMRAAREMEVSRLKNDDQETAAKARDEQRAFEASHPGAFLPAAQQPAPMQYSTLTTSEWQSSDQGMLLHAAALAQDRADLATITASGIAAARGDADAPLVAALKRKNKQLEADNRRMLLENEIAKEKAEANEEKLKELEEKMSVKGIAANASSSTLSTDGIIASSSIESGTLSLSAISISASPPAAAAFLSSSPPPLASDSHLEPLDCICDCDPQCVAFAVHTSIVTSAAATDRATIDSQLSQISKLKQEKKVLKSEVIRLRQIEQH